MKKFIGIILWWLICIALLLDFAIRTPFHLISRLFGRKRLAQPLLKKITGPPADANFKGSVVWELLADYTVQIFGLVITIPRGFQSDLASIPKAFQWFIGTPWEEYFRVAALIHDYLYFTHSAKCMETGQWVAISRDTADNCLLELMRLSNVPAWKRNAMYWAVHKFAGSHWDNDAEDTRYLKMLSAQIVEREDNPEDYGLEITV
jgi:hypothetical protein